LAVQRGEQRWAPAVLVSIHLLHHPFSLAEGGMQGLLWRRNTSSRALVPTSSDFEQDTLSTAETTNNGTLATRTLSEMQQMQASFVSVYLLPDPFVSIFVGSTETLALALGEGGERGSLWSWNSRRTLVPTAPNLEQDTLSTAKTRHKRVWWRRRTRPTLVLSAHYNGIEQLRLPCWRRQQKGRPPRFERCTDRYLRVDEDWLHGWWKRQRRRGRPPRFERWTDKCLQVDRLPRAWSCRRRPIWKRKSLRRRGRPPRVMWKARCFRRRGRPPRARTCGYWRRHSWEARRN
jgi:hypothetical protein